MSFMKFKSADEAAAWLKGNLVELEGGELAIKESVDLAAALEKKSSDYTANTTEKGILLRGRMGSPILRVRSQPVRRNPTELLDTILNLHSKRRNKAKFSLNKTVSPGCTTELRFCHSKDGFFSKKDKKNPGRCRDMMLLVKLM